MVNKQELIEALAPIKKSNEQIRATNEAVLAQLKGLIARMDEMEKIVGEVPQVKQKVCDLEELVLQDAAERESKRKQVIIHDMNEGTLEEEKETIAKICEKAGLQREDMKFARRLGKKQRGQKRPLLLGLKDAYSRDQLINKTRIVNQELNINIQSDLTRLQRMAHKSLVEELKSRNASKNEGEPGWKLVGPRGEARIVRMRE